MALSPQEQAAIDAVNGKSQPSKPAPSPSPQTVPSHASIPVADTVTQRLKQISGPQNPLLPLVPVLSGAARAAGTGVGNVFDVLNRASAANQARILRGNQAGAHTFVHSEPPEQYQKDTAEIARQGTETRLFPSIPFVAPHGFGPVVNRAMTKAQYDKMPGWWHQSMELMAAIREDPTTYVGGAGILEHLGEAIGLRSFPAFSKAVQLLQTNANPKVQLIGHGLASAYDLTHYKGAAQRSLANTFGAEGIHYFRGTKAINNARRTQGLDLSNTLMNQYHDVLSGLKPDSTRLTRAAESMAASGNPALKAVGTKLSAFTKGLTSNDEDLLYHAIHEGTVAKLSPALQKRAAAFKQITDSLAHLEGTPGLQEGLAHGFEVPGQAVRGRAPVPGEVVPPQTVGGGFGLPPEMQRFEGAEPRGLQGAESYRQNYIPTKHYQQSWEAKLNPDSIIARDQPATAENRMLNHLPPDTREPGGPSLSDILRNPEQRVTPTTSAMEHVDKNLLERGEGAQLLPPALQRKIITARLKSGAQAIAAHDAEQKMAKLFGVSTWQKVPPEAKAFFQETWNEPGGKDFWGGLARGAIDIPKVGLFALPFRHMANIGSLATLADPLAIPGTLGNYAHMMVMGTGSKKLEGLANRVGATKAAKFLSPDAAASRRAGMFGKASEYGVVGTPSQDRTAAGWIGRIPGIGDIYRASNHALWTFDDAAKATRFNRLLKQYTTEGLDESHAAVKAANQTSGELIDYSNSSPLTQAIGYIAPFATYRTKAPVAIGASVLKHPERTLAAGRLSPELIGDLQQGPPNAKGQSQVGKSYLPLAETLRGIENPASFARATVGYPLAMAASGIGGAVSKAAGVSAPDIAYFATYGKDPDLKYLANSVLGSFPGGEAALAALGKGEFANQGSLSGAVRGQTGFGLSRGPSPTQIALPGLLEQAQSAMDAATKKGDTTTATAIQRAIERVRERYRLYVP